MSKDEKTTIASPAPGDTTEVQNGSTDVEASTVRLPYPKSIIFIVSNEFCERFNYYGMRTILVLYLTGVLLYDQDTATVMYHIFTSLVYFICIVGAIIADSWLGKFRTILYLSIVYAIGSIIMSLGAMPPLNMPGREITILGLLLIAFGSGGIKPCVAAFGGDQFKMPEQAVQMARFFSVFYFSINAGSLISTSVTPILRQDVHCFGENSCYSLAFGVPGILMIISIVIFVVAKRLYVSTPPAGNMFMKVSRCIGNAIKTKVKQGKTNPKSHWLDHSEEKYGKQLVAETKILLRVLLLYVPLPVFWALFDQQGSRWTFQATRMDGTLGGIIVKPDQMQVINPFLILVFIPLYDVLFYPLLAKCGIRRPLQKLTMGGILAGISFLLSAIVELQLEKTYPIIPVAGEAQLRLFNGLHCEYNVQSSIPDNTEFILKSLNVYDIKYISVPSTSTYTLTMNTITAGCENFNMDVHLESGIPSSYFIKGPENILEYEEEIEKSETGYPIMRTLVNSPNIVNVNFIDSSGNSKHEGLSNSTDTFELPNGNFEVTIGDAKYPISVRLGGVYTVMVNLGSSNEDNFNIYEVTEANSLSMMWLVPQFVVMTLGEVMFSVTGLQFSYSQAPESMKAVLQACWQLTVAVGNLIVAIVAETRSFKSQAHEFFLFAGIMFLDMVIFMYIAWSYKPIPIYVPEIEPLAKEDDPKQTVGNENLGFKSD